jgi:uncharacterized protein
VTSALYRGHVMHARRDRHARHAFRYPVYVACVDLAELPALHARLRLFSYNRPNLFSLHDRDYADAADGVAAAHRRALAAHALPAPDAVRLVTNLRVAHYTFNPVSFFLGYTGGALSSVVAEVNNTYGGRHRYVLGPQQQIAARPGRVAYAAHRELFVSPLLHGDRTYTFDFAAAPDPGELRIGMRVKDPTGATVLAAKLDGARVPLGDRALAAAAVRYPLMTAQVIAFIHLEAMRLRARGVPYRTPGADHRPLADPDDPPVPPRRTDGAVVAS